jgi:hypothetical protein
MNVLKHQQQQHIQIQLIFKLIYCTLPFEVLKVLLEVILIKLFMVINLYSPGLFAGTGIGTFFKIEGLPAGH